MAKPRNLACTLRDSREARSRESADRETLARKQLMPWQSHPARVTRGAISKKQYSRDTHIVSLIFEKSVPRRCLKSDVSRRQTDARSAPEEKHQELSDDMRMLVIGRRTRSVVQTFQLCIVLLEASRAGCAKMISGIAPCACLKRILVLFYSGSQDIRRRILFSRKVPRNGYTAANVNSAPSVTKQEARRNEKKI